MVEMVNMIFITFLIVTLAQVMVRMSVDLYFDIKERIRNEKAKH